MTLSKNTLALIYTGILVLGFFVSGILDVLDYIIVKALLFSGFAFLGAVLVWIAVKESDTK
ncbi:hypothetical protein [Psychroserpens jangbogonensis]|uniref:hypothetical protein n=1 Tax=Psychroserpens jangbogonensis TaxID=1484460 RepID=UPI00053E410C|nr:hypothetical protein [Psychroserpens jangbogonensis]